MTNSSAFACHIGIVLHDFEAGGSERIAIRLGNAWSRAGRRVTLFCGSNEGRLRGLVDAGCRVVEPMETVARGRRSRNALSRTLAVLVAAEQPDLLFVPGNYHIPLLESIVRMPKPPRIVVKLSNPLRRSDRRGLRRWLFEARLRRTLGKVDLVVAMSPELAEEACDLLPGSTIVSITQPTLDEDTPPPSTESPYPGRILGIGRLVPQKNWSLAIHALHRLADQTVRLTILGDGPERARLERLIQRLGLAHRVLLPGYQTDTRAYLDRARLLILPSRFEGFPAVTVEALAAGVPVVATACSPAMSRILHRPELGLVVAEHAPEPLTEAIEAMLAMPPPDRQRLAAAVIHHRIGVIAPRYLEAFDAVVRDHQAQQ